VLHCRHLFIGLPKAGRDLAIVLAHQRGRNGLSAVATGKLDRQVQQLTLSNTGRSCSSSMPPSLNLRVIEFLLTLGSARRARHLGRIIRPEFRCLFAQSQM
jgi:hypothetical protein